MVNETNNIRGSNPIEPSQLKDMKVKAPAAVAKINTYSNQEKPRSDDTIQLSDLAKKMPEYESIAKHSNDMDMDRVERIQTSLESGTYQVDELNIAQKIIQDESQF